MTSVKAWAQQRGYAYRHIGDELFDHVPADIRSKTALQPVVASDLARLVWMQAELASGNDTVIWLDSDVLIAEPEVLQPPNNDFAVGREVWVQADEKRLRCYRKVHNAALLARRGSSVLAYYRHAAEQILRAHRPGHMVPQLVGPKLLTALHNIVPFAVWDDVGMLSPLVARDLLAGSGPAFALFEAQSNGMPAAMNLCRSSVASGQLAGEDMSKLIEQIRQQFVN